MDSASSVDCSTKDIDCYFRSVFKKHTTVLDSKTFRTKIGYSLELLIVGKENLF